MEILEFCVQKLQALEHSHGVGKFELYYEKSASLGIEIREGKLDHLSRSTDQGLSIRILKDQRLGFSYTFDLSPNAVEQAIRTALEIAELMPADPYNDLCSVKNGGGFSSVLYPSIENFDATGLEEPLDKKIEIATALEKTTLQSDPRVKRVRRAAYDETAWDIVLIDHQGEQLRHRQTLYSGEVMCVAEDGDSAESGYDACHSTEFRQFQSASTIQSLATTAATNATQLLQAKSAPTMVCPAVFKNSVVVQLIGFLASSFSAENIDKKFSLLVGKKGEKLFSDKITLIDDGLLAGGLMTAPFDGEGAPSQTTCLVDHGLIQNFLYDGYYARKHGVASTSNSRRGGVKSQPGIGPTNLYLKKGSLSLEDMFAGIKKGIYLTNVMGLHTANPVTGEFSVGASGILIEKGKLASPVKGFAIAGNLIELFRDVSETGSDLRFWGSIGAPSLLVRRIAIGGA